jgi:TldD protein
VLSLALVVTGLVAQAPLNDPDPILRAMVDELERSRALRVVDLDKPYHIEYSLEDIDIYGASASLGALLGSNRNRARVPQISVRVGSYEFDNTNHVYSGYPSGARYDPDQWPLDNNYSLLRQCFWLATDRAYKSAVESLARKRAALKSAASPETLPDFTKVDPVRSINAVKQAVLDETAWSNRVVKAVRSVHCISRAAQFQHLLAGLPRHLLLRELGGDAPAQPGVFRVHPGSRLLAGSRWDAAERSGRRPGG